MSMYIGGPMYGRGGGRQAQESRSRSRSKRRPVKPEKIERVVERGLVPRNIESSRSKLTVDRRDKDRRLDTVAMTGESVSELRSLGRMSRYYDEDKQIDDCIYDDEKGHMSGISTKEYRLVPVERKRNLGSSWHYPNSHESKDIITKHMKHQGYSAGYTDVPGNDYAYSARRMNSHSPPFENYGAGYGGSATPRQYEGRLNSVSRGLKSSYSVMSDSSINNGSSASYAYSSNFHSNSLNPQVGRKYHQCGLPAGSHFEGPSQRPVNTSSSRSVNLNKLAEKVEDIVTENMGLRQSIMEIGSRCWKISKLLDLHQISWIPLESSSADSGAADAYRDVPYIKTPYVTVRTIDDTGGDHFIDVSGIAGSDQEEFQRKNLKSEDYMTKMLQLSLSTPNFIRVGCNSYDEQTHKTISGALDFAKENFLLSLCTILVYPGVYWEFLNIESSVRIIGVAGDVEIKHPLSVLCNNVIIQNIRVKFEEDFNDISNHANINHAIAVFSRNVWIEGCDLTSCRGHCIYIDPVVKGKSGGSSNNHDKHTGNSVESNAESSSAQEKGPFLVSVNVKHCRLHHPTHCGVFMTGRSQLNIKYSEIEGCGTAGVESRDHGEMNMVGCKVMYCMKSGIFAHSHSHVSILSTDVNNCGMAGIELSKMSRGRVLYSRIYHGLKGGIFVHDHGKMFLRNNHIFANSMSNLDVRAKGSADAQFNHIYDSRTSGVYVSAKGDCFLRFNEIYRNFGNGIELNTGNITAIANQLFENQRCAVFANGDCSGTLRGNDLRFNRDKSIGSHNKARLPKLCEDNDTDEGGQHRPSIESVIQKYMQSNQFINSPANEQFTNLNNDKRRRNCSYGFNDEIPDVVYDADEDRGTNDDADNLDLMEPI